MHRREIDDANGETTFGPSGITLNGNTQSIGGTAMHLLCVGNHYTLGIAVPSIGGPFARHGIPLGRANHPERSVRKRRLTAMPVRMA